MQEQELGLGVCVCLNGATVIMVLQALRSFYLEGDRAGLGVDLAGPQAPPRGFPQ